MKIKHIFVTLFILCIIPAFAKGSWQVSNVSIDRNGEYLAVKFDIDFSKLHVESARALLFTPVLSNGDHKLDLSSIGVYGRSRYFHYLRRDGNMLTDSTETVFKNAAKPQIYSFEQFVPYQDWMNGANLDLLAQTYGCCHKLLAQDDRLLDLYKELGPVKVAPAYLKVKGKGVKERDLSGEAWIQFVVNKTDIRPELFNNPVELGKITASIDTLKLDSDITITGVWLKGFASPESPYAHNADLARGRVDALRSYIQQLYKFPKGTISTDFEPEDWAGLRQYVDGSNLNHRNEILAIIDTDMDPDIKEAKIKKSYPAEYSHLLKFAYPPLRHTEYKINYTVRNYTDIDEIKRIMETDPRKLDQNEFYLLASSYETGTPEFNDIFETCVKMFPNDETANLNAAMAALESNDVERADKYLVKAGDSLEAIYARGMSALIKENYADALKLLKHCADAGMPQAQDGLSQLTLRTK